MKQIRIPSFVQNLFRDLRDRRLLLPALLLVVALFAVPILLKSHSSTDRASTASIGGSGDGTMRAVPAVVAQQVGVTNYRKRLNQLQSKNPFHQQYTATPDSSSAPKLQASTGTTSTGTAGTVSSDTDTSSSSGPVSSVAGSTSPGSAPVSSSPPQSSSGGGSNSAAPGHHTNPGVRYYAWR